MILKIDTGHMAKSILAQYAVTVDSNTPAVPFTFNVHDNASVFKLNAELLAKTYFFYGQMVLSLSYNGADTTIGDEYIRTKDVGGNLNYMNRPKGLDLTKNGGVLVTMPICFNALETTFRTTYNWNANFYGYKFLYKS